MAPGRCHSRLLHIHPASRLQEKPQLSYNMAPEPQYADTVRPRYANHEHLLDHHAHHAGWLHVAPLLRQ
jgi:hypothetical protein